MSVDQHSAPDHDELLVARLAAGDLAGRELQRAKDQVAECSACARLAADLGSIHAATVELAAVPLEAAPRSRDFRLTEADAARLRQFGWRALLARFAEPRFAFTMPLAGGLAAIGIVGLLVSSLSLGFGTAGAAPESRDSSTPVMGERGPAAMPAAASAAPSVAAVAVPSAAATSPTFSVASPAATQLDTQATAATASAPASAPNAGSQGTGVGPPPSPLSGGPGGAGTGKNGATEATAGPGQAVGQPSYGTSDGRSATGLYAGSTPPGVIPPAAPTPVPSGFGPASIFWLGLLVVGIALGALRVVARRRS